MSASFLSCYVSAFFQLVYDPLIQLHQVVAIYCFNLSCCFMAFLLWVKEIKLETP